VSQSNFRDELEEVWVPKDAGELEGLLLTIQNEPGKRILKHKIQQTIEVYNDLSQKENYTWNHRNFARGWPRR
jgi:ABC-type cobalt transport system substrate-binding protein